MNLKLLFWNEQKNLPRELFLFRMAFFLFGIVGTVLYTTPNEKLPKLLARSYRKINSITLGTFDVNDREQFQLNMLSLLMTIAVIVVIS